jgi:response regulator RpfG family c-di-GMP phosphodiesterase
MPKMTGVQLCRELEKRKHPAIRVILTGYAELNSIITAINEAGIFRYITKPVSKEKLRLVV